jgi:hypothetical protein
MAATENENTRRILTPNQTSGVRASHASRCAAPRAGRSTENNSSRRFRTCVEENDWTAQDGQSRARHGAVRAHYRFIKKLK